MKRVTCPYLGLKDDPTTVLDFPSPGNLCHQARPVAPVKGSYQEKYCLTEEHAVCPLYQASHPVPLPAVGSVVSGKPTPIFNRRQIIAVLGIPALVAGVAALVYAWPLVSAMLFSAATIPSTGP